MSSRIIVQLCEDSLTIKNLDLSTLLKKQEKRNKMTFQGYHTSCEAAKTYDQPILTDNC